MVLGKGKSWALCTRTSSFPPTLIFSLSLNLRGAALSESPSSPWSWTGLLLQGPASSCWSLQVPGRCLKIWGGTFYIPHQELMSHFIASEVSTCKGLRHLGNLHITLRDSCIFFSFIGLATVALLPWKGCGFSFARLFLRSQSYHLNCWSGRQS